MFLLVPKFSGNIFFKFSGDIFHAVSLCRPENNTILQLSFVTMFEV